MKLRAKSDHRIREFGIDERNSHPYYTRDEYGNTCHYKTLKEVADNWEDVPEEPEEFWFIDDEGGVECGVIFEFEEKLNLMKSIGNYFETKEEAEKAVEKLKARKRLKDKGFRFEGIKQDYTRFNQQVPMRYGRKYLQFNKSEDEEWMKDNWEDLDLLFGGEE